MAWRNVSFGHVQDLMLDDGEAKKGVDDVLRLLREAQRHYTDEVFVVTTTKIETMRSGGDAYFCH